MVREIHKLLWYCQKEKWQHYLLKSFPDSCDRLSLKAELTTNALLSPFLSLQCKISQFASFGKRSQLNRLNAFFFTSFNSFHSTAEHLQIVHHPSHTYLAFSTTFSIPSEIEMLGIFYSF